MMRVQRLSVMMCIVVMLGMGGVACAQEASALVLERSGIIVPDLQPYSEIFVGTTVSLSPGARLVFLHYGTCQTVTTAGGTITFGADAYDLRGGTKEADARGQCPRRVTLKGKGELAGTMMRGIGPPGIDPKSAFTLSTKPSFVLTGTRAADFSEVRVSKEGKEVLQAPLDGRRFRWPGRAAPLAPDSEYELVLVPLTAGTDPMEIKFRATAPPARPAGEALTLIHLK